MWPLRSGATWSIWAPRRCQSILPARTRNRSRRWQPGVLAAAFLHGHTPTASNTAAVIRSLTPEGENVSTLGYSATGDMPQWGPAVGAGIRAQEKLGL